MQKIEAKQVLLCNNDLGEGLFFDQPSNRLWWVDIAPPSELWCLDLGNGASTSYPMPEMISYAVPMHSGGLLVAAHGGLSKFDPTTRQYDRIKPIEPMQPFNRSNDACCDLQGRLWVGTMPNNIAPDGSSIKIISATGGLYRFEADLSLHKIVSEIAISNSTCFSPDGKIMYFCDSLQGDIWKYDFDPDTGTPSNRQVFATYPDGVPDGSTVDAEGGVWNARHGGSCVVHFLPDGTPDTIITLPCTQITTCTFAGPDLCDLYITTSRQDLTELQLEREPLAGALFKARVPVPGTADIPFKG